LRRTRTPLQSLTYPVGDGRRQSLAGLAAVVALLAAGLHSPAEEPVDPLLAQLLAGLLERDARLGEFRLECTMRSALSERMLQIERDEPARLGIQLPEGERKLQSRSLHKCRVLVRGERFIQEVAVLVGSGTSEWGMGARDAGPMREEGDDIYRLPSSLQVDDGQTRTTLHSGGWANVRPSDPRARRAALGPVLGSLLVWVARAPAGEYVKEHIAEVRVEGPVDLRGEVCYRLLCATDRPEAIGPQRLDLWIAPELGYAVIQFESLLLERDAKGGGNRWVEQGLDLREVAPGLWLPSRVVAHQYGYWDDGTGAVMTTWELTLDDFEENPAGPPDSEFTSHLPLGTRVSTGPPLGAVFDRYMGDTERAFAEFEKWVPPEADRSTRARGSGSGRRSFRRTLRGAKSARCPERRPWCDC
jgi:hypothetical protein